MKKKLDINKAVEMAMKDFDFKGLAEAYQESQIAWNAENWKKFVDTIREETLKEEVDKLEKAIEGKKIHFDHLKSKLTKAQEKRFDKKFYTMHKVHPPFGAIKQHLADELARQRKKLKGLYLVGNKESIGLVSEENFTQFPQVKNLLAKVRQETIEAIEKKVKIYIENTRCMNCQKYNEKQDMWVVSKVDCRFCHEGWISGHFKVAYKNVIELLDKLKK